MNNLTPTPIVDKNGHSRIVHKNLDKKARPIVDAANKRARIQDIANEIRTKKEEEFYASFPLTQEDIDKAFPSPLDQEGLERLRAYIDDLSEQNHSLGRLVFGRLMQSYSDDIDGVSIKYTLNEDGFGVTTEVQAVDLEGIKVNLDNIASDEQELIRSAAATYFRPAPYIREDREVMYWFNDIGSADRDEKLEDDQLLLIETEKYARQKHYGESMRIVADSVRKNQEGATALIVTAVQTDDAYTRFYSNGVAFGEGGQDIKHGLLLLGTDTSMTLNDALEVRGATKKLHNARIELPV